MNVFDSLRKGFGFLLMSFGVSSPKKKPIPLPATTQKSEGRKK